MPTLKAPFDYDPGVLLSIFEDKGIAQRWEKDGTINSDVFSWWFEGEIGGIAQMEFGMYYWHLRAINSSDNWGWLRNMFHSIA